MHRCWTSLRTPTRPWVWAPNCPFEEGEAGASPPTPTSRLPACQLSGTLEGTRGAAAYSSRGSNRQLPPWCSRLPGRHWSIKVVSVTAAAARKVRFSGTSHSWCHGAASWGCNQPSSPPPLLSPASTSACLGHLLEQRPDPGPQGKALVLLPSPGVCLRGPPCAHRPWEPKR